MIADSPSGAASILAACDDADDLTILGAGPAGLAVAFYAQQRGLRTHLYERDAEVGGLCRTFVCGTHRYDSGAHRFHERDAEVTQDLRQLMGDALLRVNGASQIFDRGRFIDFPPRPLNWLRGHGLADAARASGDLLKARWRPRAERTFEDVAVNRYGRRLASRLLLTYSEKLWGCPASALAPEAATRRLNGLGLSALILELFSPRRLQAHLDGTFLYPRTGYGALPAAIARQLPPDCVHTGCEVAQLECANGLLRGIHFVGRPALPVSGRVVSTLPLTLLVRCLGDALPAAAHQAASQLRFRHLRLVLLRLAVARHSPNASIYIPRPDLAVSRVSEPKNRSPLMAPASETALVAEVPCSSGDALASLSAESLADRVVGELATIGLLDPQLGIERETRFLANAYPVYELGYAERVRVIHDALQPITNLDVLGRGGRFWYSHLHDQFRSARDYVRALAPAAPRRMTI